MSTVFKKLRLLLIVLLAGISAALRARDVKDMPEHEIKGRAEILRLASSSSVEDRLSAVEQLAACYMDYSLLWKLMNDADPGVRGMAVSAMTALSCTTVDAQPLSPELAQKMADMLEKDVTPERISAAFVPGAGKDAAVGRTTTSAVTLNHLHRYYLLKQSPAGYAAWQRRVLRPLFLTAAGSGTSSGSLHACAMELFATLSDTSLLLEALPVLVQKLDDPALPATWLLPTLEALWQHPLLGHDRPLNVLLLAQLSPRLEALRPRILGPMQEGQDKEQAARLINEIAEVIQYAREKLGPQPARSAEN